MNAYRDSENFCFRSARLGVLNTADGFHTSDVLTDALAASI